MTGSVSFPAAFLALLLLWGSAFAPYGHTQEQGTPPSAAHIPQPEHSPEPPPVDEPHGLDWLGLKDGDLVAGPRFSSIPDDPCLQPLYKNWYEFSADARQNDTEHEFVAFRILLDRATFTLKFQGLRRGGAAETVYQSACGIGEIDSPTPEGRFIINHVYSYPDAAFFGASGEPLRGLYHGFFAPLLACDDDGLCQRFQDLGIHGFNPSAYPDPAAIRLETCGAVSGGCIRLPDPCEFKTTLIRLVGIGPPKRNDRGVYHWLNRPVEVVISGNYPGTKDFGTLVSLFEQGLSQVRDGLKNLWSGFGP